MLRDFQESDLRGVDMRRVIVLTIAGGALAAYLAYPYGLLAACLAYLIGGMVFAAMGLVSLMGEERAPAQGSAEAPARRSEYRSSQVS